MKKNSINEDLMFYSWIVFGCELENNKSEQLIIKDYSKYSLFPQYSSEVFKEICEFVIEQGGKIDLIKSKRKRTKLDKETGKYKPIVTKDFTGMSVLELLNDKGFDDYKSLEVHDISLTKIDGLYKKIEGILKERLDRFVGGALVDGVTFITARKALYKKILASIEMGHGHEDNGLNGLRLDRYNFKEINDLPIIHVVAVMSELRYVDPRIYSSSYIENGSGEEVEFMPSLILDLKILPPLLEILKRHQKLESILLDTIFDKKYKELRLYQKKESVQIEGTQDFEADTTKFVDLQKQYPYAEITAVNHAGKSQKYKVKEKIKLNNESSENKL